MSLKKQKKGKIRILKGVEALEHDLKGVFKGLKDHAEEFKELEQGFDKCRKKRGSFLQNVAWKLKFLASLEMCQVVPVIKFDHRWNKQTIPYRLQTFRHFDVACDDEHGKSVFGMWHRGDPERDDDYFFQVHVIPVQGSSGCVMVPMVKVCLQKTPENEQPPGPEADIDEWVWYFFPGFEKVRDWDSRDTLKFEVRKEECEDENHRLDTVWFRGQGKMHMFAASMAKKLVEEVELPLFKIKLMELLQQKDMPMHMDVAKNVFINFF